MRTLLTILFPALLVLTLVPGWTGEERNPEFRAKPAVTVRPMTLDPTDPARRRVGALTWIGGIELSAPDRAFGGFSSLHVAGGRVTLLSDGGAITDFRLDRRRLSDVRFGQLPAGPGTGWDKRDRDSESMAVDPASGATWVGFENSNQIWRYGPGFDWVEGHVAPPAMKRWPDNRGAEAMALLPDRRMLVIDEARPWPRGQGRAAIMFSSDPTQRPNAGFRFSYMPPPGYDVSDATALPDGRVLVLNRRFDLPFVFSAKVTAIDLRDIHPGALVRGREIATLAPPLIHDNFEGIAVTREKGATMVWLVSDDNQSALQRSYLLKFRLDPAAAAAGAPITR